MVARLSIVRKDIVRNVVGLDEALRDDFAISLQFRSLFDLAAERVLIGGQYNREEFLSDAATLAANLDSYFLHHQPHLHIPKKPNSKKLDLSAYKNSAKVLEEVFNRAFNDVFGLVEPQPTTPPVSVKAVPGATRTLIS